MKVLGPTLLVVVIAFVIGLGTYFITSEGSEFTKLTFDIERKRLPLVIIQLDRVSGDSERSQYDVWRAERRMQLLGLEHDLIFDGRPLFSTDGQSDLAWDRVYIESFAKTSDYVNLRTSPEYTNNISDNLERQIDRSVTLIGHIGLNSVYTHPVVLMLGKVGAGAESTFVETVADSLADFGGRIDFALPITDISSEAHVDFNYLALIKFSDDSAILSWLDNTIRKSQFGLLRSQVENVSLVVAEPA